MHLLYLLWDGNFSLTFSQAAHLPLKCECLLVMHVLLDTCHFPEVVVYSFPTQCCWCIYATHRSSVSLSLLILNVSPHDASKAVILPALGSKFKFRHPA